MEATGSKITAGGVKRPLSPKKKVALHVSDDEDSDD